MFTHSPLNTQQATQASFYRQGHVDSGVMSLVLPCTFLFLTLDSCFNTAIPAVGETFGPDVRPRGLRFSEVKSSFAKSLNSSRTFTCYLENGKKQAKITITTLADVGSFTSVHL